MKRLCIILLSLIFLQNSLYAAKVGLLITATGKYINFVEPLVLSAERYFCQNDDVTYFIFSDGEISSRLPQEKIVHIEESKKGWPFDSMLRFAYYAAQEELLSTQDYIFSCDADLLFVNDVGEEIFGDLVLTQHPYFINKRGTYETSPLSKAYVSPSEGENYYTGAFYGGTPKEFFKLITSCIENIEFDLKRNVIALWHDESHLNRYAVTVPPTLVLSASYYYPEDSTLPLTPRILALNKDHAKMRE